MSLSSQLIFDSSFISHLCIAHLNQIPVPFLKLLFCLLADECVRVVLLKCRHNTLNPLIEAGRFPLSGFSLYAVLVLSD